MRKLSKKQRKKLKEREENLIKNRIAVDYQHLEAPLESQPIEMDIDETTLNRYSETTVEKYDPLLLEFYEALKKQKVFGAFNLKFSIKPLKFYEKRDALSDTRLINLGNIVVKPFNSKIILRLKILRYMIRANQYSDTKLFGNSNMTVEKALAYYCKEYFKNKDYPIKHSRLFFQFIFGTITAFIGTLMMLYIIYYFWGMKVLSFIIGALLPYIITMIYQIKKFKLF